MFDFQEKEQDSILKGPTELRLEKKTQQMVEDMVSKHLRIPEPHEKKAIEKMLNPVHYVQTANQWDRQYKIQDFV
jgi:hypothetical protein